MNPHESIVIFFASFVSPCLAVITVQATDSVESNLATSAVQILESCYGNRVTPVGLAGTSAGIIGRTLWSQKASPVTLIDGTRRIVKNKPFDPNTQYKLEVFVVSASSAETLMKTLVHIKASVWWNHMAAFLIIHWAPSNHGCSNAFEMLWTAWKSNILDAKLLCHHRSKGQLIYTFNPFTSHAPHPWRFEGTYSVSKNHPWTLFVREYAEGEKVCDKWDSEKANDLGGYVIRVSMADQFYRAINNFGDNLFRLICKNPRSIDVCSTVLPVFNATVKLYPRNTTNESLGDVDREGHATGILREVAQGLTDIGINGRYLSTMGNVSASYPFVESAMHSITQYSAYKSQLSKIHSVIDDKSRYGLYLVVLTSVVFFKYFHRRSIAVAQLNTLRIICNSTVPKLPRNAAARIFLASVFVFALTMQGIYQGKLASLLTNPQPLPNVDNMRDLAKLGHTIHGYERYRKLFDDPSFEGRYVSTEGQAQCTETVLRNSGSACVAAEFIVSCQAAKFNLHISRDPLMLNHVVFPIRPDWPLERRLNTILLRSVAASLISHLRHLAMHPTRRKLKIQQHEYEAKSVKVMTFKQLTFAFVILGIGLGIATVTFIGEVRLRRRRLRIVNIINRLYHRNE